MFQIGGYVIYRAEGVCRISDIRTESFGSIGGAEKYYILTPLSDEKSTVFVPVANETLVGMMRPLLSADEIVSLAAELREERMEWIPENRVRNTRFREILAVADRRELIVMIHTILSHNAELIAQGKKPTSTDENALARAKRLLFDEFRATVVLEGEDAIVPLLQGELIPKSRT